jgi:hypothetical protein
MSSARIIDFGTMEDVEDLQARFNIRPSIVVMSMMPQSVEKHKKIIKMAVALVIDGFRTLHKFRCVGRSWAAVRLRTTTGSTVIIRDDPTTLPPEGATLMFDALEEDRRIKNLPLAERLSQLMAAAGATYTAFPTPIPAAAPRAREAVEAAVAAALAARVAEANAAAAAAGGAGGLAAATAALAALRAAPATTPALAPGEPDYANMEALD